MTRSGRGCRQMDETLSLDAWLQQAKSEVDMGRTGMFLAHNGVVRGTSRDGTPVSAMELSADEQRLAEVVRGVRAMPGISYVRAWTNAGVLAVGDSIMYALVAGDIRENVLEALTTLIRRIKTEVVKERELR